jgi:hypothetical protein
MRKQRVKNPQELIYDYSSGMPISKLSKKYDLSEGGVYYYLRIYGIKINRYSKSQKEKMKAEVKKNNKIEMRRKKLSKRKNALIDFILEVIES